MSAPVTVVAVGCELDRLFSEQRPALPVPAPPQRDDLRDLFEAVSGPLRGGEHVIVVVGDWLPAESLERVHTVRSLLETDRVAICLTGLPPLAASVQAALAAALASRAPSAGALAGAIDGLGKQLVVLAWLRSVAGLRHPAVTLMDHARSALPWSSFGIGLQPTAFVGPARLTEGLPLAPPDQPVELLIAPSENADLHWITAGVVPALGGVRVRQIAATLHGPEWWGTSRLVEAVGVPIDLEALADAVLPNSVVPCRWCGEPIAGRPCPFCGDAGPGSDGSRTHHRASVGHAETEPGR